MTQKNVLYFKGTKHSVNKLQLLKYTFCRTNMLKNHSRENMCTTANLETGYTLF